MNGCPSNVDIHYVCPTSFKSEVYQSNRKYSLKNLSFIHFINLIFSVIMKKRIFINSTLNYSKYDMTGRRKGNTKMNIANKEVIDTRQ